MKAEKEQKEEKSLFDLSILRKKKSEFLGPNLSLQALQC